MAGNIFQRGVIRDVWYNMGVFDNARGTKRMTFAPFEVLFLDDGIYFQPVDAPAFGGSSSSLAGVIGTDTQDEAFYQGRGEFYYDDKFYIMGENEMGDWKGNPESWKGMHQIGLV